METVINQHGIDIEALKSSRLPLTGGPHVGESSISQIPGIYFLLTCISKSVSST